MKRGFVPLFLIHFVHKNAGRASLVSALGIAETLLRRSNPHAKCLSTLLLLREQKMHPGGCFFVLAEKRGFEPPRALTPYLLSKEAQSATLTLLHVYLTLFCNFTIWIAFDYKSLIHNSRSAPLFIEHSDTSPCIFDFVLQLHNLDSV